MDSERRHQLAQNDLKNGIFTFYRDYYKPNANLISIALLAIVLIVAVAMVTSRISRANRAAQWKQIFEASLLPDNDARIKSFETLAEEYKSGEMGARVRLVLAQAKLSEGSELLYKDRIKAATLLNEAVSLLDIAETLAGNEIALREEVLFNSAMAHESLAACSDSAENITKAKTKYDTIVKMRQDGAFTVSAKERLSSLERPTDVKLLSMLATAEPAKPVEDININLEPGAKIDGPSEINFDALK
jgi:hypothetical protein